MKKPHIPNVNIKPTAHVNGNGSIRIKTTISKDNKTTVKTTTIK